MPGTNPVPNRYKTSGKGTIMESNKPELLLEPRSYTVIISVVLCTIADIIITCMGAFSGWPSFTYWVFWVQMAIIWFMALYPRIPFRVFSFLYCLMVFNTIGLAGVYFENFLLEIMLFTGSLVIMYFLNSVRTIITMTIFGVFGLVLHVFILKTANLSALGNRLEFYLSLAVYFGLSMAHIISLITASQREKDILAVAEQARRAERSKADFLANMSHEIRTPMNAIIGMCELILRETNITLAVREFASQIQNSGRSLLSIINDILDFSKIESGKMELVEEEFNIASTLNDVVNMAMTRMGDKDLEVIVKADPTIPVGLLGDEVRIRQIMINLITNAVKYTPEGIVTITVEKITRKYGINLNVTVKDSGIGIAPDDLEKLFVSFQQVDTKKNRSVEGTGLGLVITKRLLATMGGFINVSSTYGKGSTFHFVIPLRVSNPEPFIKINDADNINAVWYINTDKFSNDDVRAEYKKFFAYIGKSLRIRHFICKRFKDLKMRVESGNVTHVFVGKQEYMENKKFFESIADDVVVVVIKHRRDTFDVPSNMRTLFKPAYEVSIAGVFNNESAIADLRGSKTTSISFTAPKARVLIVDDNPVNLQVAAGLMQPYKMQIITAESGKDALRLLGSKDYNIVFMDHMMPDLDGVETTRLIRMREEEYFKKLPIIALTANAIGGAREMFLRNGFDGFISKPIELSALDRCLKQHLPEEYIVKNTVEQQPQADSSDHDIVIDEETKKSIDAYSGIFYVGGNKDTYFTILNTYVNKGREKHAQIEALFNAADWSNYIIEVHALKSSSLSVGAKALSEMAKRLELNGKAGDYDYIRENHKQMHEEYAKILKLGAKLIEDNANKEKEEAVKAPAREISKEEIKDVLSRIASALSAFDDEAVKEAAQDALDCIYEGEPLKEDLENITSAAADFDYDAAESGLKALLAKLGLEV